MVRPFFPFLAKVSATTISAATSELITVDMSE